MANQSLNITQYITSHDDINKFGVSSSQHYAATFRDDVSQ